MVKSFKDFILHSPMMRIGVTTDITRDLRRDVYLVIDIVFFVNTDVINNSFGSV